MSCNSTDLGFLKQSVSKLREEIKENSRRLDIANLLKMCELGLITKEEVLDSEAYKQYTKSLNLDSDAYKQYTKSLNLGRKK